MYRVTIDTHQPYPWMGTENGVQRLAANQRPFDIRKQGLRGIIVAHHEEIAIDLARDRFSRLVNVDIDPYQLASRSLVFAAQVIREARHPWHPCAMANHSWSSKSARLQSDPK